MRRIPLLARILAVLLAATWPAFAIAAETATVIGQVTDATGAAVPGVVVTARNVDTGIARSATTGADGSYRVPVLPPGRYEVTAELSGFSTVRRSGVRLYTGAEAALDFEMKPAAVAEELTVTADTPVIETTNATIGAVIGREQVDLLPLIGRDFIDILRTVPGVQVTAQGFDIGGARGRSNSYVVDGVDVGGEITGNRGQGTNVDAIQEFQVLTNQYKAEFGRAGGGVVSVLTRSGTNEVHGGAFFMYRDQGMIARNPFLAAGQPNDPFRRRQWGGHVGGPIKKDRTHFFASLDYEDRDTFSTATLPLPTPEMPVDPVVAEFLRRNDVVIPTAPGAGSRLATQRMVRPEYVKHPRFSGRIDHSFDPRHSLTLGWQYEKDEAPSGRSGTIFDTQGGLDASSDLAFNLNHKWVRSSTHLNELYLRFDRFTFDGTADFPNLVNISIDEAGGMYLGGNPDRPQGRTDHSLQVVNNYTIHQPAGWRGSHVWKLGADVKAFRSDSFFDSNFRGTYFFSTVANFLAGRPRRYTAREGNSRLDRPVTAVGLYAQDDWTINRNLTLNLGLRWDYERGTVEALKDIPPGSPVCVITEVCGKAGSANADDYNNVSPRIGFVYDPAGDGRTAIHGGAGFYYDQVILNIQGNARFTAPKITAVQIENPTFPDPFLGGTRTTIRPDVQVVDEDLVTPRSLRTSLGVKRQLTTNSSADLTFTWNKGYDQVLRPNINTPPAPGAARPYADFTNVTLYNNEGEFKYRAVTLEVRRRMAGRFSAGVSYTLSKSENNGETFLTGYQFPRQPERNWGPSDEDRRHVVVAHGVARLPWDFHLAAVFDFRSERPLDVFASGVDLNGDLITGDYLPGHNRNQFRELTTDQANQIRAQLNALRPNVTPLAPIPEFQDNPKWWNVDVNLEKRVKVRGERGFRITAEVFNLFNHPNYFRPSGSITSVNYGRITSIDTTRDARMRSLQLTVQIDF